jgi:hypothetical protein
LPPAHAGIISAAATMMTTTAMKIRASSVRMRHMVRACTSMSASPDLFHQPVVNVKASRWL